MKATLCLSMLAIVVTPSLTAQEIARTTGPRITMDNANDDARTILDRYASAWRGDQEMELRDTMVLGFRIDGKGGGEYHVIIPPGGSAERGTGLRSDETVVFETDIEFLRRLDRGELNALTAMGQARASDPTPLVPRFPEGFRWTAEARGFVLPLVFHFWTRSWPEVIPFGDGVTREVHGGNAAVFYYDRGLRTSWYQLEPGMHINREPRDQTNPFPSLFIMTRGRVQAKLGGIVVELREGEAVFVPVGMTHEFWAEDGQYGELVLLMFGEGA